MFQNSVENKASETKNKRKGKFTVSDYLEFDYALNKGLKTLRTEKNFKLGFLVVLGINVGLRISDLLRLTFEDIENGILYVQEKKTDKRRTIKINDNVLTAFEVFKKRSKRSNGLLFLSNSKKVKKPFSVQYVNRSIKKYFAKPNLNISTHTLRKTFGRRVWDNNNQSDKALVYLSEIFEHSSISITRRYLGIRQEQLNEIYMNL